MIDIKRTECAILPLVLKGVWYDMIDKGDKRQEYSTSKAVMRQIQRWWWRCQIEGRAPVVEFRRGYASDAPRMAWLATAAHRSACSIHPDWGEPNEPHYVISFANRISLREAEEGGAV